MILTTMSIEAANFFLSLSSYEAIHKNKNLCAVEIAKLLLFTPKLSSNFHWSNPENVNSLNICYSSLSHFIQITLFINMKIAFLWSCFPIANCFHSTSSAIKKPQIYILNGEIQCDLVRFDAVVADERE